MTSRTPISLRLYAAAAGRAQREREKEAEGGEWPQEQMKMLKDVKVLTVNGGEDGGVDGADPDCSA